MIRRSDTSRTTFVRKSPPPPTIVALSGLAALAVAMGIGRFAFTPILPMMQHDTGLSVALGGWLAAANYVGHLVGAMSAMALSVPIPGIMIGALLVGGTFMVVTAAGMQEARAVAGRRATGLMAAMTAAFATGQIVGPIVVSALVGARGDFARPLLVAGLLLVASAIALAAAPRRAQLVR